MLYHAQNGIVKLKNAEIDYVCYGTGDKILIMLPGLGDALRSIKGTALPFALAYRKHSADYKVYMFSRKHPIEEGYSIRDMAKDANTESVILIPNEANSSIKEFFTKENGFIILKALT